MLPYLVLALAPLCWAANIVLARAVAELIPPAAFAFWRWSLAALLVVPFARRHLAADREALARGWKRLLLLAVLGISGFNALLYTAVHTTTAINGALIQTSMPAVIAVLTLGLYRERLTPRQTAGIGLCIAGAVLVVLRGELRTLATMGVATGDLLMVAAVLCYGLYSVLLRRRPAIHPLSFLAATFALGAAGLLPAYVAELAVRGGFALTREVALSVVFVAIFPSIVAYFCWNKGVDRVGPNRAGLFVNLIPVFASLLSTWLLGESVRGFHIAGMALIAGGMFVFYRTRG
ncbi:MAG: DMT family transporter [Rhodospirillales bacterium]|jgi:drug/metabolite transporter (DMT)-like permease|nr:DMT family transporter [Rhodospirillales bacterium]